MIAPTDRCTNCLRPLTYEGRCVDALPDHWKCSSIEVKATDLCFHLNIIDCPTDWQEHETTCPDCGTKLFATHDEYWDQENGEADEYHYWSRALVDIKEDT